MTEQKQYYLPLDGLRGISALLVIFGHLHWFVAGWLGLKYFFVLSGFLITGILLREKENKNFFGSWKRYFFRRGLRVFPLYFGYLFLLTIGYWITGIPGEYGKAWPMLFTFTYNLFRAESGFPVSEFFVHFWSLCVEEQFYLFWPLIVLLLNRKIISVVLLSMLFIGPAYRYLLAESMQAHLADAYLIGDTVWMNTICKLDGIAMGALIALYRPDKYINRTDLIAGGSILLFLIVGLLLQILSVGTFTSSYFSTLGYDWKGLFAMQHVYTLTLANLMYSGILLAVISRKNNLLNNFLEHPFLLFSGKISFGIYVFHYPIIQIFRVYGGLELESWFAPLILIPVIYLVATLSFFLYEKRFLDMKEGVARRES